MPPSVVHLVCNSHIDPVWLWEWEEGAAVTLATFRTAADLCEEYDRFIFCHNEAILYQWVEEYEPALFARIRKLVGAGKWHIMGGWHLQPDCNMPSGESFVRQILLGKRYFRDRFGVDVRTAANLDPFGHSRGLVQILARSGYDSYLFCRPQRDECGLPADAFTWVGFDGSTITGVLASSHYNSSPGGARAKVEQWIDRYVDQPCSIVPWGVGNHGGGPSRRDLDDLDSLMRDRRDVRIVHSTPEAFVDDLRQSGRPLPRHETDLNPWAVGCYTSMSRVKRRHRQLENALLMAESMAATAAAQGLMDYPRAELTEAMRDLATSQFHDALPGSSVEPVEDATVQLLDHGIEIVSRVKASAFFALTAGQPTAAADTYPILVYNPHPFRIDTAIECELQPPWPHGTDGFLQPHVTRRGRAIPTQAEKPHSNINEDHRKRIVFAATLEPGRMNRFDCRLEMTPRPPAKTLKLHDGKIRFKTRDLEVVIGTKTGLVDRYRVGGIDYMLPGAFRPLLMKDDADPWGMRVRRFRTPAGRFRLMSRRDAARVSGVADSTLPPVRIIEDGPVRCIIEAILACGDSIICQRYTLPKRGSEFTIELRVLFNERDRMLKLSLPTALTDSQLRGQVDYGVADLPSNGDEAVAHAWAAVVSNRDKTALTCVNDAVYGLDMARGEMRLSLLRAPAHAAHPTGVSPCTVQDRFTPRIDQGEHVFRFWINAGPAAPRLAAIDREAAAKAQMPMALSCCPSGEGAIPMAGPMLSDRAVQLAAVKYSEDGDDLIIRLFNPTGRQRTTKLAIPFADAQTTVRLGAFEIKTMRLGRDTGSFTEVNLLEETTE